MIKLPNNVDFFTFLIKDNLSLEAIYYALLDYMSEEELGAIYRVRHGKDGFFYVFDKESNEHKSQTIKSSKFSNFLHDCIEDQKGKLIATIADDIFITSSKNEVENYLYKKLKDISYLISASKRNIIIKEYSEHINDALTRVANSCLVLYKIDLSGEIYQHYYNIFNNQESTIKQDNESYQVITAFRQSPKCSLQASVYKEKIAILYHILKSNKFIDEGTELIHFGNIFGVDINSKNHKIKQIVWIKKRANRALRYLIEELYNKPFITSSRKMWDVVSDCFVGVNGDFKPTPENPLGPIANSHHSKGEQEMIQILKEFLKDIR